MPGTFDMLRTHIAYMVDRYTLYCLPPYETDRRARECWRAGRLAGWRGCHTRLSFIETEKSRKEYIQAGRNQEPC